MIQGKVTDHREAVIDVSIRRSDGQRDTVAAIIDTGFNGEMTLPPALVQQLGLKFVGNRTATLADGSDVVLDVFLATLDWDGEDREVLALQSEGGPLIGMELLWGFTVTMHVVSNGRVEIVENAP